MSDINTYADETAIAGLGSAINGDLVLNQADSSLYLCTNADTTGIARWKKFANDSEVGPTLENRWGASFDGTSDYIDCGAVSDLNSASTFSISAWYKKSSAGAGGLIIGAGSLSGERVYIEHFSNNKIYVGYNSTFASVSSIADTDWHNVVYVRDSGTHKLYLDGSDMSLGGTPASTTGSSAGNNFYIGRLSGYGSQFGGLIDEAAFFNTVLSAPDISKMYNGTAPNGKPTDLTLASSYDTDRSSNLLRYYRMGDDSNDSATSGGSIATITDSSGNGNHATQSDVTSQPTFSDLTGETIYS